MADAQTKANRKAEGMTPVVIGNSALVFYDMKGSKNYVDIVVGAYPEDRVASLFRKESLKRLIGELQAIHDKMEDV